MLIKNYGLFWERDEVTWGSPGPGNRGRLLGFRGKAEEPVDFREQAGVYVLYDGSEIVTLRLVYVGQAGRRNACLYNRLNEHRDDHLWNRWTRFSWFGIYPVSNGELVKDVKVGRVTPNVVLDIVEGLLITSMEPPLNRQGPRWNGIEEYVQGLEEEDEIDEIAEGIEELRDRLTGIEKALKLQPRKRAP